MNCQSFQTPLSECVLGGGGAVLPSCLCSYAGKSKYPTARIVSGSTSSRGVQGCSSVAMVSHLAPLVYRGALQDVAALDFTPEC